VQRDARHLATDAPVDVGGRDSVQAAESVSPVDAASSNPEAAAAPEAVVVDVAPLRQRLDAARRDLRARGILMEDLSAELRADLRAAETALAEGRAADAEALVEGIETAAGALRVDAPFVRAKLDRTHAALREAGAQGRDVSALEDLAASALQDFLEGRTDATNRTLNEILRRLASGASGVAVP
jgi:hypothetical protein